MINRKNSHGKIVNKYAARPVNILVYLFTWLPVSVLTSSRFRRIACIDPRLQTTQDRADTRITVMQKDERRTGARVFVGSGAVGDDPFIFVERHGRRIRLDGAQ